ncbi:hypothetical protein LguiB_013469 [Lonicera macranthoides]
MELALMVQCLKNGGQMVFPIFYDVDPDVVHHQCGSYEEAFCQHRENGYDENVIQEWRDALNKVGRLKGLELKKETGGHQGELVKIIKDKVVELLKQNNKHEDLDLVGMPSRMEKLKELLNIHSDGVRFIVIHGMGGLGKTTIAEVIYDKYQHHFECHSFLKDVREKSKSNTGIVGLQNQLRSNILKTKMYDIDDYNEGIKKIKDAVHGKKVLIVLDDVDEKFQIEALAGSWKWFDERARIIITTRNKEVLCALKRSCHGHPEIYGSYQLDYLDANESLELFSKHAFMSKSPPKGYDTISKEIASTAAGLPLVLKVIGSSLYGETDEELWEEKIKELKELPDEEVQKKLRLSFDPLTVAQKEIFLDIACLFIGKNKINPLYMWDDCGFYPRNVLNVLERRSLITIGDDDILRMHDQLRDLGRQIVREGKLDEWGRWSRLWDIDKSFEVYRTGQGTEKVKALCLNSYPLIYWDDNPRHLEGEKFLRLPNLRYLTLDPRDTLYGDFEHCLPNLRWLQWRYYMLEFTPTNLHLRNLVILDLSSSEITEQSDLWSQIQMPKKLKVLYLCYCHYLRKVHFLSTFSNLERLSVSFCEMLCSLDGIEELESLRYLDASCCSSLKTLPNLSRLTKLKELNVHEYRWINDPGPDKLESFKLLHVWNFPYVERLPDLSNLKSLKELNVSRTRLTEIRGLGELKSLEVLDMSQCKCIKRVFGLINLKRLKRLNIRFCVQLIEIHGLERLESLEFLDVGGCNFIELPDLSKLKSLKALSANGCEKLTKIGGLEELISLEYLDIGSCKLIKNLPDFSNFRKLKVRVPTSCEIMISWDSRIWNPLATCSLGDTNH